MSKSVEVISLANLFDSELVWLFRVYVRDVKHE